MLRRTPVSIALVSRLVTIVAGLAALALSYPRRNPIVAERGWDDGAFAAHTLGHHLATLGVRWDGLWYLRVAAHGYDLPVKAAAFFPLYPTLLAGLHLLGLPRWLAGTVLSVAATVVAASLLYAIVQRLPGCDERAAVRATVLWLFFPAAVVLGAPYPEALLAALLAGAWVTALQGRRVACGVLCGLALLAKPLGVAALAFLFFTRASRARELAHDAGTVASGARVGARRANGLRGEGDVAPWRTRRAWFGAGVAAALALLWPLALALRYGQPLRFVHAQGSWARGAAPFGPFSGLWNGIVAAAHGVVAAVSAPLVLTRDVIANLGDPVGLGMQSMLDLVVVLALLGGAALAWRWFGAGAGIATLLLALVPLSSPSHDVPLLSAPRFVLLALPAFAAAGRLLATRRSGDAVVVLSAATCGCLTAGFALWSWIG